MKTRGYKPRNSMQLQRNENLSINQSLTLVNQKLTYKGSIVATTALLAEKLGATPEQLSENFNANKGRYEEGKHFFTLKGSDLKEFKDLHSGNSDVQISSMTRHLYLWTERGSFNHVKSLGSDEAWDAYQILVDTYFKAKEISREVQLATAMLIAQQVIQEQTVSLQLAERKVDNLQIGLDNLLSWVSILKVSIHNRVNETKFDWRTLKAKSIEMGYDVKRTESGRFKYQNLYHVDVFRICYPKYNYDFKIREY